MGNGIGSPALGQQESASTSDINIVEIGGQTYTLGQKTMAESLPVTIASDQTALPVTGSFYQATQPISAVALPLPTGASTAVKQDTGNTSLATLAAAISSNKMQVDVVSVPTINVGFTGTGVGYVQFYDNDSGSAAGNKLKGATSEGAAPSGTDKPVRVAGWDGTNVYTLKTDTNGQLQVTVVSAPTTTVSGTVTANAGTNLNTSALALESGGNLASIKAKTDNIPSLGQALAASSVPVVLTASQLTTLTPPAAITGFSTATKQSDGSQKTQIVDGSGNVIGSTANALDINIKSGNPTTITVTQATGTNLHTVVDSGSITANAGTNLNTSALALESGGNLASIKAKTDNIPPLGQALAAASVPVVLTAAQLTTLTPATSVVITDVIPGVAANDLGKAEDAAHTTGDTGVFMLGVRNDSNTQRTSTNGDYVPINTDANGNITTAGTFTEVTGLTAGALNADLVPSTDVNGFKSWSLQITGTWVGTLSFQGSNDATNWISIQASNQGYSTSDQLLSNSSPGNTIYTGTLGFRYLRVRMTSYTSGTANGRLELYTHLNPNHYMGVGAAQYGTWVNELNLNNGSSTDRMRNNSKATLLASAARTATTNASFTLYNGAAMCIVVDVTARAAATTLTPKITAIPSGFVSGKDIWTATAAINTGSGTFAYYFWSYPTIAAPTGYTQVTNVPLLREMQLGMTHSDANSITYSVTLYTIIL